MRPRRPTWVGLDEVRAELAAATVALLAGLDPASGAPTLGVVDEARRDVADFVAVARSAPRREGGRIVLVPQPEVGARLYAGLSQLRRGLDALGRDPFLADEIERRAGLDSIPALKRRLIEHLAGAAQPPTLLAIAADFGYPEATVHDALEDLAAYAVVDRYAHQREREDTWVLSDWARNRLDAIGLRPARPDRHRDPGAFDGQLDDDGDPLDWVDRRNGLGPYRQEEPL